MRNKMAIVRWILTAALLYGVYTETGIWTTILLTLIVLYTEINTAVYHDILKEL